MSTFLTFLFVIWMITSTLLQADDNPKKNIISPGLTAFCGILVLCGGLYGEVSLKTSLVLALALFLLALSDGMFEMSTQKPNAFTFAMIFGVLSGFTIGVLFVFNAINQGVSILWLLIFAMIGILLTAIIYRYLEVDASLKIPVYIYLVQAVILFTGGLASLYIRNYHFAIWGVFIYISDSLVGIRAFPSSKRPIQWLTPRRILFSIIVLYYSAQYALVSWAW